MRLKTEEIKTGQPVLIVNKHDLHINELLKNALRPFHTEVFISPHIPENLEKFDYIFVIDDVQSFYKALQYQYKQLIFISKRSLKHINEIIKVVKTKKLENIKVIQLPPHTVSPEELDKVLWFGLDKGGEIFLNLDNPLYHIKKSF
jgi:hypothetical protein